MGDKVVLENINKTDLGFVIKQTAGLRSFVREPCLAIFLNFPHIFPH